MNRALALALGLSPLVALYVLLAAMTGQWAILAGIILACTATAIVVHFSVIAAVELWGR